MFYKIPYWLIDFAVRILTLNLYVIKKLIKPYANAKTVLDLGCGVGSMSSLFKKGGYLGVDIDKKSIEYAQRSYPGYNFRVSDITTLKSSKRFDLVLVVGVLHHISDKEAQRTLMVVSSCLKKGGKLLVIEAIPPLFKWNLAGQLLRTYDNGKFIRETKSYKKLIEKKFKIKICKSVFGGFFDYAYIAASS